MPPLRISLISRAIHDGDVLTSKSAFLRTLCVCPCNSSTTFSIKKPIHTHTSLILLVQTRTVAEVRVVQALQMPLSANKKPHLHHLPLTPTTIHLIGTDQGYQMVSSAYQRRQCRYKTTVSISMFPDCFTHFLIRALGKLG